MRYGLIDKVTAWFVVALGLAGSLAAWYWLGTGGGWLAGCLALALSVFTAGLGLWAGHLLAADVDHARGQAERSWREAERIWQFEEAEDRDFDGDGEIGPPRKRVNSALEQVEQVLTWCYENATNFGQERGRVRFGGRYDWAMDILASKGLVDGRKKGAMGWLVFPDYESAREALASRWTPQPEYVKQTWRIIGNG